MHATSYLAAGLFEAHDRNRFEVIGISLGPDDGSGMRQRVVQAFDRFEDVHNETNASVIRRIRDLKVDIVVDLMGYSRKARPSVLLNRVAPVQVNFLGFPGTTGMGSMDYIVADPFIATDDLRRNVSEKLVILPDCYQINDDRKAIADRTPTRADEGLPDFGFVFCCFNHVRKITPHMFDAWMRILSEVQDSVLWLLGTAPSAVANLRAAAEKRQVSAERLIFAERQPLEQHLARIRLADLFLDTFPCNAHTTASDALWAGCPVLSMTGNTFASRVCGSLLMTIGLPELAVQSLDAYERLALRLASQPGELEVLKARLQKNRLTSPLFDTRLFCHNLERAYEEMFRRAASGDPPAEINVAALPRTSRHDHRG
jgi:protein O-GlcNAc transferase